MTSQSRKWIITIQMLLCILRSKGKQIIKFGPAVLKIFSNTCVCPAKNIMWKVNVRLSITGGCFYMKIIYVWFIDAILLIICEKLV